MNTSLFAVAVFGFTIVTGFSESVILRQDFDGFEAGEIGVVGAEEGEGGAWKEFGKRESSPQVSDQEFYAAQSGGAGKSIRIIRDEQATQTTDFWLSGSWSAPLDAGKLRVSFRVFRDSSDSGFSVHLGTDEKLANVNTIAVSVGNRSTSLEKLAVMMADKTWRSSSVEILAGIWTQVAMEIDFSASTYTVLVDGTAAEEGIPFEASGALRRISFLPTVPDGNISFIDDVEVVALD